ncbi:MAG: hypothetical protein Q8M88_07965 [Phenylobacterium sp.]|uniref:hypothetical protein n=1 Tax=Phenylobacterium sp. TaxID=1871053 RepID=UPI0027361EE1|nr:hypothetical protein [Phenylobacterium sp.]MDP3174353.1 hypothetical protein [Phenylobacterium sp.]
MAFALVTAILVWLVAPALGGFGARANDEALIRAILSATVAFAVIGLIVATTAAFTTLLYAPFVLWRDVKAKIPQKPTYNLKPDASITQAMYFAVTGVWDKIPEGDFASKVANALEDFHQIAADGGLHVWYQPFKHGVWQRLEKSGWVYHNVVLGDVLSDEAVMRRRRDGSVIETCRVLGVCRSEWDDKWAYRRSLLVGSEASMPTISTTNLTASL